MQRLRCTVIIVYAVYLVLNLVAFFFALADEQWVFTLVVPIVTGGLHGLSLLAHLAINKWCDDIGPVYPLGKKWVYLGIDVASGVCVLLCVVALWGAVSSQWVAILSTIVLMGGSVACFCKSY